MERFLKTILLPLTAAVFTVAIYLMNRSPLDTRPIFVQDRDNYFTKWSSTVYHPPESAEVGHPGEPFLAELPDTQPNFIDLGQFDLYNFTFVTAASADHFNESLDMIESTQRQYPDRTLIYYDLGLTEDQRKQIRKAWNVKLQAFQFEKYPQHVQNLFTYAFKPIAVYESLQQYGAIWWQDASVRHPEDADLTHVMDIVKSTGGIAVFGRSGFSIYRTTMPGMYQYLPGNLTKLKTVIEIGATTFIVYNTERVYRNVIHWWYMCALTEGCIAPEDHRTDCHDLKVGTRYLYPVCHRYDQSALALLLSNTYGNSSDVVPIGEKAVQVLRTPAGKKGLTLQKKHI